MVISDKQKYASEESILLLLNTIAKRTSACLEKGMSREEILKYFLYTGQMSREPGQQTDFFSEHIDYINSLILIEQRYKTKQFHDDKLMDLYNALIKTQYKFVAKDGKEYTEMVDFAQANDRFAIEQNENNKNQGGRAA